MHRGRKPGLLGGRASALGLCAGLAPLGAPEPDFRREKALLRLDFLSWACFLGVAARVCRAACA